MIMYQKKTSYDYLYLFRDVMRCGSFQKAAKETGCTTAAISKKIAKMQKDLEITLFESDSEGMVPTAAGLYLYDNLDTVLWNLDATLQRAKNFPSENSMKLNLGIYDMIASSFFRPLIQTFTQMHPDIELVLSAPFMTEMRSRLLDGRMDAAVVYSVGLYDEPSLVRKPILRGKSCVYYHNQLLGSNGDAPSVESFRDCPFVCLNTDLAARDTLQSLPFEPRKVIFADSLKSLYLYVNSGLACTVLGPIQQFQETAGISFLELPDADNTIGMDIVWDQSHTNPAISLLVNCAEKLFPTAKLDDLHTTL